MELASGTQRGRAHPRRPYLPQRVFDRAQPRSARLPARQPAAATDGAPAVAKLADEELKRP